MQIARIQAALRAEKIDGWLFYDHHHRDPIAYDVLGLPATFTSRRWYYLVPAEGAPRKLVHRIEAGKLDSLPGTKTVYSSWQELEAGLASLVEDVSSIAMQYSPRNAIMYVSMVDAGTVELVRALGKQVVSSADLVSQFAAVLTEAQIATHFEAQRRMDPILAAAFERIGTLARAGEPNDEFSMIEWMRAEMRKAGLWADHGPNVSCGPNSADSHYEASPERSRPIATGDFILIDFFAKLASETNPEEEQPDAVWYDITWTGVVNREPSAREQEIFKIVRQARDAAIHRVEAAFFEGHAIHGFEADDAARELIRVVSYGPWFTHRTGHSITTAIHGNGAHLDNLETHDERLILPYTCFSVEPGIYFPGEFGVRSEVDMITRPGQAVVTGPRQTELLRI